MIISEKIAEYRKLKVQADDLNQQMKEIKKQLEPAVEAVGGKWEDAEGYAKFIERKPSVSCNGKAVRDQARIYAESDDPTLKAVGATFLQFCKENPGYSYLQVK